MDKVVSKIKNVRVNWWEAFKEFWRLPGYHYYQMPKELKFRYPAPGSCPRTEADRPNLYKKDWKMSFKDSQYNIRPIKKMQTYEDRSKFYYYGGGPLKLDPNNPKHKEVLKGPVRDMRLHNDTITYSDILFDKYESRESRNKIIKNFWEKLPEEHEYMCENVVRANDKDYDEVYNQTHIAFHSRGQLIPNDRRLQHMYLELEYYITDVMGRERIETKEMDMYRGTPKKWQVLDDEQFSRDQIEKIQSAIKAPSADELERYKVETDIKMPLPINNENVSKWRDEKKAIDSADFNAKLIEFEKKRDLNYFAKRYEKPKQLSQ